MKRLPRAQHGMVLIVTLAMLVVITLFVISMIRLGNTNAVIVGNMQAQKTVEGEAQQAIEMGVNQYPFFDNAIQEVSPWNLTSTQYLDYSTMWTNFKPTGSTAAPATQSDTIQVYRPQCVFFQPASGYSALSGIAPQNTYWDMQVTASDSRTGGSTEIHQGIQMNLPAGNCK